MPTTTTLQGIPLPVSGDLDDVPADFATSFGYIEPRLVMRFANTALRNSSITSPVKGMAAFVGDSNSLTVYSGTEWRVVCRLALPAAVSNQSTGTNSITATTPTALTNPVTSSVVVKAGDVVMLVAEAWLTISGGTGDVRAGLEISGAGLSIVADAVTGHYGIGNAVAAESWSLTRIVTAVPDGTLTAQIKGWKTGTPTSPSVNYPGLQIVILRTSN